jgi:hypothetical protein
MISFLTRTQDLGKMLQGLIQAYIVLIQKKKSKKSRLINVLVVKLNDH